MKDVRVPSSDNEGFPTGQEKLFLSVQDIVKMTGMSMTAVYTLLKTGKLPAVPVKATYEDKWKPLRVRREDFEKAVLGNLDEL